MRKRIRCTCSFSSEAKPSKIIYLQGERSTCLVHATEAMPSMNVSDFSGYTPYSLRCVTTGSSYLSKARDFIRCEKRFGVHAAFLNNRSACDFYALCKAHETEVLPPMKMSAYISDCLAYSLRSVTQRPSYVSMAQNFNRSLPM